MEITTKPRTLSLSVKPATAPPAWLVKAEGEQRYTLSIAYPAEQLDAHSEFTRAEELEKAAWRYLRESRSVGLMHKDGTAGAGELVESYIYRGPEWTVGDQVVKDGDWLVGIVWSPEAWASIKAGIFQGISFQGWAAKVPTDPAAAPVSPAK